jgi:hypothetical protein
VSKSSNTRLGSASLQELGTGNHVGFRVDRRQRESAKVPDKRLAAEDFVDEDYPRCHRYVGDEVVGVAFFRQFSDEVRESFVGGCPVLASKVFRHVSTEQKERPPKRVAYVPAPFAKFNHKLLGDGLGLFP